MIMSFFDKSKERYARAVFSKFVLALLIVAITGSSHLYAQEANLALGHKNLVIGEKSMYVMPNPAQDYINGIQGIAKPVKDTKKIDKNDESDKNLDSKAKEKTNKKTQTSEKTDSKISDSNVQIEMKDFPVNIEKLKYFGYDIFTKGLGQSAGKVAISDSYKVGPGDVFQISVWGSEEASFTSMISPNGDFLMPGFGHVNVTGKKFAGFRKAVKRVIGKELSGFEIAIVAVKPRKNNVFVVGEVNNPGVYGLEGAATSLSALFAAGGATTNGSLRKIQVKRGKKLVGTFDLYDFLIRGDRSSDVDLQDGDTVFVPLAGPRVKVTGAVKRPAIYELKPNEMYLGKTIDIGGGIITVANLQKIQIRRTIAHGQQIVFSREVSRRNNKFVGNNTPVQDMDIVRVFTVSPRKKEFVTLEGHVFEPGPRPWREGIMLSEILQDPDMMKKEPALNYGEILREGGMGGEYQVVSFNPGKILAGDKTADVELKAKDRIVIFPASLMRDKAKVSVSGSVVYPGTIPFSNGMRVKDLVFRSGGLKNGASLSSAELSRREIRNGKLILTRISIDLGRAMKDDPKHNIVVKPFDSLMVRAVPNWSVDNFIELSGEVKYPGRYSFQPGERLSSVLARAKGYSPRAYLKAAVFIRKSVQKAQIANQKKNINMLRQDQAVEVVKSGVRDSGVNVSEVEHGYIAEQRRQLLGMLEETEPEGRIVIKLTDLAKFKGSKYDIALEPGDQLYIPTRPSSVMVDGAVYNSMGILWEMNKSIRHYLNKVGGITKNGDSRHIYLIRADGTVASRRTVSNFLSTKVEPGDIIFVPTRIRVPRNNWKRTLDVVQTISSLALTALAVDTYNR